MLIEPQFDISALQFYIYYFSNCMTIVIIINGRVDAGTDSETALRDAFVMFDEDKKGKLAEE